MTKDTEYRIELIAARTAAAAKGPWVNYPRGDIPRISNDRGKSWLAVTSSDPGSDKNANGEFIAHAREDIPWLLQKLTEQDVDLKRIRKMATDDDPEAWYIHQLLIAAITSTDTTDAAKLAPEPGCSVCGLTNHDAAGHDVNVRARRAAKLTEGEK